MKKEAPAKKVICTIPRLHDGWMLSLAPWCPGCHIGIINRLLCEVLEELGIQADIVKVEDLQEIVNRGIMMTPAVFIDGEAKIVGRVPTADELKKLLR